MQQSSFFVRTVRPTRATQEPPRTTLLLDPTKVVFQNYPSTEISLAKVVLKNESRFSKKIMIVQPSKDYFQVKCSQKEVGGREQVDIFVRFNPQREKANIEDQFIVKIESEATELHVPIYCQYRTDADSKFSSSKQLLPSRQTELKSIVKEPARPNFKSRISRIAIRNASINKDVLKQAQTIYIREAAVQQFQVRFKRISDYVRQKYVKNQVYLGETQLPLPREESIRQYSQLIQKAALQRLLEQVKGRHKVQYCEQGPAVKIFQNLILSWDIKRNKRALTFQSGLNKLQEEVRKYVVSLRFQNIQNSLRIYQQYQKKQTRHNKRLKVQQYLQYLNCRLDDHSLFLEYQLEFDKSSLKATHLPINNPLCFHQYHFQITQRIGFDNWLPMNTITHHHQELYQLKDMDVSHDFVYLPPGPTQGRKGAPQELTYKQASLNSIQELERLPDLNQQCSQQIITDIFKKDSHLYLPCQNVIGVQKNDWPSEQDWLKLSPLSPERWPWTRK